MLQVFIALTTIDISLVYTFKKVLGKGRIGSIKEGKRINELGYLTTDPTRTKLAIKILSKEKVRQEAIEFKEPFMLLRFDHPNIIKIVNTFQDSNNVYMALEYCEGNVLLEKMPEQNVRELAYQMLCALAHIHEKHICHLDIKPSNFMLKSNEGRPLLKLYDFEFAADWLNDIKVTPRGTLGYIAPELLEEMCGAACDMWSLGITLYYLLCGEEPFKCKDHIETSTYALTKKISYEGGVYIYI